jgi:hypothetical protein
MNVETNFDTISFTILIKNTDKKWCLQKTQKMMKTIVILRLKSIFEMWKKGNGFKFFLT